MKKKTVLIGLILVVGLQISVLAAEYLNSVLPLWTGQEVLLKTVPVDPRSLFRGNYARLNYEISTIDRASILEMTEKYRLRNGEIIYVMLQPGENGVHEYAGASLQKPGSGQFIRGRTHYTGWNSEKIDVKYGIEAFFAPKEDALALEKELRTGAIAKIMLSGSGSATLKEVGSPDE